MPSNEALGTAENENLSSANITEVDSIKGYHPEELLEGLLEYLYEKLEAQKNLSLRLDELDAKFRLALDKMREMNKKWDRIEVEEPCGDNQELRIDENKEHDTQEKNGILTELNIEKDQQINNLQEENHHLKEQIASIIAFLQALIQSFFGKEKSHLVDNRNTLFGKSVESNEPNANGDSNKITFLNKSNN